MKRIIFVVLAAFLLTTTPLFADEPEGTCWGRLIKEFLNSYEVVQVMSERGPFNIAKSAQARVTQLESSVQHFTVSVGPSQIDKLAGRLGVDAGRDAAETANNLKRAGYGVDVQKGRYEITISKHSNPCNNEPPKQQYNPLQSFASYLSGEINLGHIRLMIGLGCLGLLLLYLGVKRVRV